MQLKILNQHIINCMVVAAAATLREAAAAAAILDLDPVPTSLTSPLPLTSKPKTMIDYNPSRAQT